MRFLCAKRFSTANMSKNFTLSIVIPAYNEEKTIHFILNKIKEVKQINDIGLKIIIVKDCSSDNKDQSVNDYILQNPYFTIQYYSQTVNKGKGAPLHTGILKATGDFLIIYNADLEYNSQECNIFIKPVCDGFADVVYGSRFMGGNPHRILFFWLTKGNKFLTFLSNLFINLNFTDMETCYKLFRIGVIRTLILKEKRFGFEPEVCAKIAIIPKTSIY